MPRGKAIITYANLDSINLALRRQDELASHQSAGRLEPRLAIVEADGYPKLSTIGQRRRLLKGRHRGFVSPTPLERAVIMRYTGEVDEQGKRKKAALGIHRGVPKQLSREFTERYNGVLLRAMRARNGVGRPPVRATRNVGDDLIFGMENAVRDVRV